MPVKGFVPFELEGMSVAACHCWLDWYIYTPQPAVPDWAYQMLNWFLRPRFYCMAFYNLFADVESMNDCVRIPWAHIVWDTYVPDP